MFSYLQMQIFRTLTMIQKFTLSCGMTDTRVTPCYRYECNKNHTFLQSISPARIALYASSVCKIRVNKVVLLYIQGSWDVTLCCLHYSSWCFKNCHVFIIRVNQSKMRHSHVERSGYITDVEKMVWSKGFISCTQIFLQSYISWTAWLCKEGITKIIQNCITILCVINNIFCTCVSSHVLNDRLKKKQPIKQSD